jgi:exodeoxyribonuclease-5
MNKQINLSQDQREVLRKIWKWIIQQHQPYLTFGGYAGTGKTTMVAMLRKALYQKFPKKKIAFCSYTGKATRVLEDTLKNHTTFFPDDITGTIHSLIYEPIKDDQNHILGWEIKKELEADLIILDEASMVDAKIWSDLRSFNIPILAVGDHGQLPPIHGKFNLMQNPELKLEKIHRQAKGNPIIRLSEKVRKGEEIPYGNFGKVKKLDKTDFETRELVEEMLRNYNEDLMILVGYNHSRVQLNQEIRQMNNMWSPEPQPGDRIICLKNNHKKGIYNGMLGEILKITPETNEQGEDIWYEMEAKMDDGELYFGKVLKEQFNAKETLRKVEGLNFDEMGDLFDFGYVLTVHKAQGSQSPKVLLFEQRFQKMDDQEWRRWLYTAVTRAEEELIIVG